MPTLYVENVPEEIYEALRKRAQTNKRSISAEVLKLLEDAVPTERELARRKKVLQQARKLQSARALGAGPFPSTEEMLREDRGR